MKLKSLLFGTDDDHPLKDVSDDALSEAAFELRQAGSHIGWTNQEREEEYCQIAQHLKEAQGET